MQNSGPGANFRTMLLHVLDFWQQNGYQRSIQKSRKVYPFTFQQNPSNRSRETRIFTVLFFQNFTVFDTILHVFARISVPLKPGAYRFTCNVVAALQLPRGSGCPLMIPSRESHLAVYDTGRLCCCAIPTAASPPRESLALRTCFRFGAGQGARSDCAGARPGREHSGPCRFAQYDGGAA